MIFNKVTNTSLQKSDGTLDPINDTELYRVVVGLYSAQMLSVVGNKSFGLLSIVPKTKDGMPISDFEAQIVTDKTSGRNNEVKEWLAIAEYLQSFDKVNGVAQISQDYKEIHGRKMIDNTHNVLALLKNPNRITFAVYFLVILAILGMAFVIRLIVTRKKGKERRIVA